MYYINQKDNVLKSVFMAVCVGGLKHVLVYVIGKSPPEALSN